MQEVLGDERTPSLPSSQPPSTPSSLQHLSHSVTAASIIKEDPLASLVDSLLELDTTARPPEDVSPSKSNNSFCVRCRKCDFEVISFTNQSWTGSADYLFFRNFFPKREKLNERLENEEGKVALACQCSWATVKTEGSFRDAGHKHWWGKQIT